MPDLVVTTREGVETRTRGDAGVSVMEVIRAHGFDELLALCGGCCSCATCHVYLDEGFFDRLPPLGDDEDELLESSSYRKPTSRLSCQIPLVAGFGDLRVTIAPED